MISLMDRHPDFIFNASTAQLYSFLEEDDPKLLDRIKEKVAAGQWEPTGAMWVEPDTNMPTGESFVRQLLYGQRYFERMFGARHDVCWLPDCFGFSPALPQLLNHAGVTNFFTIKVNWSETNVMPYDLFWWEGLDGSRVLAHTFNNPVGGYNAETGARAILETWKNYRGKHAFPESLLAFGYGDGGGGPTEEMLDRQRQFADFPVRPEPPPDQDRRLVRQGPRGGRGRPEAAGLGRRDVPRAPPRHADDAGQDRSTCTARRSARSSPPRRCPRWRPSSARGSPSRSSRTGGCCSATSSTTSCRARASARSTSSRRRSSPPSPPPATR